ncbi:MAG: hypothetical protein WAT41_10680 [Flavobacteriales bacterium]
MKTGFRWYRSLDRVNRNLSQCRDQGDSSDCPFALWTPQQQMPPFQILTTSGNTYGFGAPTSWKVYDMAGSEVLDLAAKLSLLEVQSFASTQYLIYKGGSLGVDLPDGYFESRITIEQGAVFYSETMRVMCPDSDPVECFHRLEWSDCGTVGTVYYGSGYVNRLYFPGEWPVFKPSPKITINDEEDRDGSQVDTFKRKEVTWSLDLNDAQFAGVPWWLLDALTEIPLHNDVRLAQAGSISFDALTQVEIDYDWKDDCVAECTLKFQVDEALAVAACCETFDPACLDPCAEISGTRGDADPAIGEFYIEADSSYYREYIGLDSGPVTEDGYGLAIECESGLVQGTGTFPDSIFNGSQWVAVATVTGAQMVNGVAVVNGTVYGDYAGQLQYSTDSGATWIDSGLPFMGYDWQEGIDTLAPEGALVRLSAVVGDCVIGHSAPLIVSGCAVPDLTYEFSDNGNGTFNLDVTMNATEGFTPGDIYISQP